MKKLIIFTAFILVYAIGYGQKIAIGLKGGLNYSQLNISDNDETSGKTGYHLGGFATFKLGMIGIQPEVIFSQQGSEVDLDDWDTKYINIPIILKIYLFAGLNLQVGPQFGFLNKAELNGQDISGLYKSSDVSAALGAGWDLPFGLSFDARYNMGLSDVSDNPAYETIKSQVFQLSVGLKIFKF